MTRQRDTGELVFSVALALLGGFLLASALTIKQPEAGTRIMPIAYSSIILAGGIVATIRVILRDPPVEEGGPDGERKPDLSDVEQGPPASSGDRQGFRIPKPAQTALVIVGYVVLLDLIGYIPATALLGIVMLKVIGRRLTPRLVVFPVVLSVALWVIFEFGLGVRLP